MEKTETFITFQVVFDTKQNITTRAELTKYYSSEKTAKY